jgi:hypothetical protein
VDFTGCCEKSELMALAVKTSLGTLGEVAEVVVVDLSGAGKGGDGGGPPGKAAGSSGQASSSQGSGRPGSSGLHTTQDAVQAALSVAEAMRSAHQPDARRQPAGGGGKKDKERQRKERQLQRKLEVARKALDTAMDVVQEYGVRCVKRPAPSPHASTTLIGVLTVRGCVLAARARCVRWRRRRRRRRGTRLAARRWQR